MEIFNPRSLGWRQFQIIENRAFLCGFCCEKVASDRGYKIGLYQDGAGNQAGGIYICPNCQGPNFVTPDGNWYPGIPFGRSVKNVPEILNQLYEEA